MPLQKKNGKAQKLMLHLAFIAGKHLFYFGRIWPLRFSHYRHSISPFFLGMFVPQSALSEGMVPSFVLLGEGWHCTRAPEDPLVRPPSVVAPSELQRGTERPRAESTSLPLGVTGDAGRGDSSSVTGAAGAGG